MSTGEPLLEVSDLHAGYGSLEAVAGISLHVGAAETVALVGRNGAGKTTSLLAIAGLRYGRFPGGVKLGGTDISRASSRQIVDAGLAHVPEGHRIFTGLTVEENLRLGAYTRRRSGRKAVAGTMERIFDLFPILRTYASRNAGFLSGGEQQMVAIGQALMAEPRVLMLDEPTSGLAPIVVRTIYDAIAQLREQGIAILIVEQSVPRALANSNRCYVMERGRIVISGDSAILAQDEHVFAIVRGTEEVPSPARTS
ncbi:MAG TPA: ABC transporter ATP-binding protein [Streptosporangiaceae bacterium]|nr:ABC transporter ATP-binding protein [Streptosporangiaceae bacterium]